MVDENENNNLHASGHEPGMMADEHEDSVALESGRPAVASAPGKILIFIVFGLICIAIVVKSLFFPSTGPAQNAVPKRKESVVSANVAHSTGLGGGDLPAPPPPDADLLGSHGSSSSSNYSDNSNNPGDLLNKLPPPPSTSQSPALPPITMPAANGTGGGSSIIPPSPIVAPNTNMPTIGAPSTATSSLQPPPPPPLSQPAVPNVNTSLPRDEAQLKRNGTEMIAYGGSNSATGGKNGAGAKKATSSSFIGADANSQFANAAISAAHNESATAERIEHLDYTIIQGKIIDCILETAIDSDLPGTLRAIVSHDVYAEAGRKILIPKGSRMLGTYNSAIKKGQARVFIVWTRVIRPDGITIDIDSPAVDSLGRSGVGGDVDNKYFEMFSSALLTSTMDIGVAAVGDALFGNGQTTTTNNGTGSTTTQSPTSSAMQSAIEQIGSIGKTIVNNTVGLSPTITIDQGTPVNVFVNKELIFPPSITDSQLYIQ